MKKLMTALLGLSLLTGTVSVGFAGDTTKKKRKKKGKKRPIAIVEQSSVKIA